MKGDRAVLKKVSVSLPFGIGSAEWEADKTERRAAWSLYIELVTRIAVEPLEGEEGLLREALNSLYSRLLAKVPSDPPQPPLKRGEKTIYARGLVYLGQPAKFSRKLVPMWGFLAIQWAVLRLLSSIGGCARF